MLIPFKPLTIEELKRKVPVALEKIWIAKERMEDRPGLHEEHIFDFETGVRLIISKDQFPINRDPLIHVSSSIWGVGTSNPILVLKALQSIGLNGNIESLGVSPAGIGHWVLFLAN